jgi:hypothetical protein
MWIDDGLVKRLVDELTALAACGQRRGEGMSVAAVANATAREGPLGGNPGGPSDSRPQAYLGNMKKPRPPQKKATADKLRSWRVSVLRARMQNRGDVQAPDQRSAEAEAARQFNLSDDERKRPVVQARD